MRDPLREWFYPELRHCRSDLERSEAQHASRSNRERLTIAAVMVPFLAAVGLSASLLLQYRPPWMSRRWIILFGAAVGAGAALSIALALRARRRLRLRQFLLARGIPLCLQCGYDLRGLPAHRETPICPECAHGISPEALKILQVPADG